VFLKRGREILSCETDSGSKSAGLDTKVEKKRVRRASEDTNGHWSKTLRRPRKDRWWDYVVRVIERKDVKLISDTNHETINDVDVCVEGRTWPCAQLLALKVLANMNWQGFVQFPVRNGCMVDHYM
jgi:hypothetical protein